MGYSRHTTLTVQICLEEPEDIHAITRELELFKATIEPPFERFVLGPFPGFHQDAFTIFVQPHGCKDKHHDIVAAHLDVVTRLRLLAKTWESTDAVLEVEFGGDDPELANLRLDALPEWTLSKDRIVLNDLDPKDEPAPATDDDSHLDRQPTVTEVEGFLQRNELPYNKSFDAVHGENVTFLDAELPGREGVFKFIFIGGEIPLIYVYSLSVWRELLVNEQKDLKKAHG